MMNGKIWCAAGLALLLGMTVNAAVKLDDEQMRKQNQFQEYALTTGEIYKVYVKKDNGVTTVTFPSAISKIAGVNVSLDNSRDFQISTKPGSYYFNLVALKDGAEGTLTIVYNRKTYVLYLIHDKDRAYSAVNFAGVSGGDPSRRGSGSAVSPARLLSLIDIVKTFDLMQQKYPSELRDATRKANHRMFSFGTFRMELLEVVRFNREDTLVFKLLMHNDTDREILYDKFSFSVQVGGKTFYMSAADASGSMPPKSASWAFFTITGTPEGGRANLAPDNAFLLGVTTQDMEKHLDVPVLPKEPDSIVFPAIPEESPLESRIRKLDEDIDRRLAKLVTDMEAVLHRIEAEEARTREENRLREEKAAHEIELKKMKEAEAARKKIVEEKTIPAKAEFTEQTDEREIGSDAASYDAEPSEKMPESELSFWSFSRFPENLWGPLKTFVFWNHDEQEPDAPVLPEKTPSEATEVSVDAANEAVGSSGNEMNATSAQEMTDHESTDHESAEVDAELSFWNFSQFPENLLVPVMWLKFW